MLASISLAEVEFNSGEIETLIFPFQAYVKWYPFSACRCSFPLGSEPSDI